MFVGQIIDKRELNNHHQKIWQSKLKLVRRKANIESSLIWNISCIIIEVHSLIFAYNPFLLFANKTNKLQ